jgi:hypothetical protein
VAGQRRLIPLNHSIRVPRFNGDPSIARPMIATIEKPPVARLERHGDVAVTVMPAQ